MKDLIQVKQAVVQAMNHAGVMAIEAFPDAKAKAYSGAVATVAVGAAEGKTLGFCNYLGEVYDEDGVPHRRMIAMRDEINLEGSCSKGGACGSCSGNCDACANKE